MATIKAVFQTAETIRELHNGYAFRLPNDSALLLRVMEFVANERLCCPFFGFSVEIEPEGGAVWLGLTGREGIKPFIQAEIMEALHEAVAVAAGWQ